MSKKARRSFTKEQKATAVKIIKGSPGKPLSQIAMELGISESALRKWTKQERIDARSDSEGPLSSAEREELRTLRKDNKRLVMERDFLKHAAVYLGGREGSVVLF